jgi:cysteinyl-tRNA synthetase
MKHNLKIYNTLTGKKDLLKPMHGKNINLFVCGVTVFDFPHIGHARTYVFFDSYVKYLRSLGFKVFYLQNITNIDDKIIQRAREKRVPPKDLALAFEKEYLNAMKILKVNSVSKYARATNYIKEIINQVQILEKKGFAYLIENDGYYFNIAKFKNYGKLANRTVSEAEDGVSRIDYSGKKINRGDFCLWKFKQEENEPSWKSPFGQGRPGWHIEDTAISEKFFGAQYDMHGGGRDLIFPHHEAEVSQMEAISGKRPLVKYWLHTGFLTIGGQKMSKSLGNFTTISDFLRRYTPEQLRFLMVKNLWHSPLDYTESIMVEIKISLEKIEEFLRKITEIKSQKLKVKKPAHSSTGVAGKNNLDKLLKNSEINFYKHLDEDFNTPKAFAVMFDLIKSTNKLLEKNQISSKQAEKIYKFFETINKVFDIIDFKKTKKQSIASDIKELLELREKYRKEQNWQASDEIRIKIAQQGYIVKDTPSGPLLEKI